MSKIDINKSWKYAMAPESTSHIKLKDKYDLFIGGEFVKPLSKKYFNTLNPSHCNHLFIYNSETKKVQNVTTRTKKDNTPIVSTNNSSEKNSNSSEVKSGVKSGDNIFSIRKTDKPYIYKLFDGENLKLMSYYDI